MRRTTYGGYWLTVADMPIGWSVPAMFEDVEPGWPAAGSEISTTPWVSGPFIRETSTAVEVCEVGHQLVLEARARPFGRARVEITLEEIPNGTRIVMSEEARSPSLARWSNPVLAPFVHVRNVEALRRLAALLEDPTVSYSGPYEGRPQRDTPELDPLEAALDEELADSFPASDPPSSWGGTT